MDIGVEISLYPLKADFVPAVHEFLERLQARSGLKIVTNSLSTQVFGGFEEVMETLRLAMGASFASMAAVSERGVFVMKVIGPLPPA